MILPLWNALVLLMICARVVCEWINGYLSLRPRFGSGHSYSGKLLQ